MKYRVMRGLDYRPSQFAIARRYAELSEAVANMGTGVVIADDGHVAAFHESQLRAVERADAKRIAL